jgi:glycosyltransferase involved in cell wall biosynthesis
MHFNDAIIVYHAYDDFSKQGEYSADCKAREAYLLQKADLVFASSNAIKNHLVQLSEDANIKVLPNGVDYEQFNKSISEPDDIKEIPHPRVGYAGAINKKINLSLIDYLATELPLASFILVGRVANLSESDLVVFNRLKVKNNVYILGEKKPKDISDYMHGCDINIMPYKTDKSVWASSGYPLKLHEYLAVGKPTVSADIDAVREFKGVVDIPTDSKEWLTTIKKYINLPDDTNAAEARKNIAKANTWSDRVSVIQDEICRLLKSH